MMNKYALSFFLTSLLLPIMGTAQTSAGKCWNIDYLEWNENQPQLHIDCGNDDAFNVGAEMTLEFWIRAYTFGENRKVMGKIDSDGDVFDNGYVLGFGNLNPYAEIWNPTIQQIPYPNSGPIPKDSAFVHMACTYSSSAAKLTDYVNGVLVGQVDIFPPNSIVANDAIFLIGAAPWGPNSFQFYGTLDEVRVWNKARTEEEIKEFMFKELKGDEEGLVAYYNFNNASDTLVTDESLNNNTGELRNSDDPCWSWANSFVPVGNERMYDMSEPTAAWFGKSPELWNYATTENGLSIITDIEEKVFNKYLVFGHSNQEGTATDFAPADAPADFERMSREWYVNSAGNFNTEMYFNIQQGAGGGDELPQGGSETSYVLLSRATDTEDFQAIAYTDQIIGEILVFKNVPLTDKYYTVGYSAETFPIHPDGLAEQRLLQIQAGPNPTNGLLTIRNGQGTRMHLYNLSGQCLGTYELENQMEIIDLNNMKPGLYLMQYQFENTSLSQKIIINR